MRFPFICCGIALVLLVHLRVTGWLMKTISSSIYEQSEEATHADDRLELVSLVNNLLKHLLQLERLAIEDDFPQQQYYYYNDTQDLNNTEIESDPLTTKLPNNHNLINCSTIGNNQDFTNRTNSDQEESSLTSCQPNISEKPIENCPLVTENKPSGSTSRYPAKTANDHNVVKINETRYQPSVCLACCEVCEVTSVDCDESNGCDRCPDDPKSSCDKTHGFICSPDCNNGCVKQFCKVSACNKCKSCEKSNVFNTPCDDCQLSSHIDCGDICKLSCNKCQPFKCPTCSINTHRSCFKSCTKANVCDSQGKDCQSNYDICNLGCNRCQTCNHAECLDNYRKNNVGKHCELSSYNNDCFNCNPSCNRYPNQPIKCSPNLCHECFEDYKKNTYDLPANQCQPPCHNNYGDIHNSGSDKCHSQSFKHLCNTRGNHLGSCKVCSNVPCKHMVPCNHCSCNQACNLKCFVAPVVPCIRPVCHPVCNGCRQPCMQPCCRQPCMQPCCHQPCMQPCCHQPWNQRGCCKTPCMPGRYPVHWTWNVCRRCNCPQDRMFF